MDENKHETPEDPGSVKLKITLATMAENTGMHALPNLKRAVSFQRRFFWTLILLFGSGMVVYELTSATIKYYTYPTQTTIELKTSYLQRFPAVTLCNQNPIRLSALFSAGPPLTSLLGTDGRSALGNKTTDTRGVSSSMWSTRGSFTDLFASTPLELRTALGHTLTVMLLDCSFAGTQCSESDFYQFNNQYYGNCFVFNTAADVTQLVNVSNSGPRYGLELTLFIEQNEYVGDLAEAAGMRFVIHNNSHMPFPEDEGFSVAPGTITYVGMTKKVIIRASSPCGVCTPETDAPNAYKNILPAVGYSLMTCQKTCYQNEVLRQCSCGDPALPLNATVFSHYQNLIPCSNSTQGKCMTDVKSRYSSNQLGCSNNCSAACYDEQYSSTISIGGWPSESSQDLILQLLKLNSKAAHQITNMSDAKSSDFITKNALKVVIYFESMDYSNVETSCSYSLSDLGSDYGGQMGLWLGFSVCTIFEFVELSWDLIITIALKIAFFSKKNQTGISTSKTSKPDTHALQNQHFR